MSDTSNSKVKTELQRLTTDSLDRLRYKVHCKFAERLKKIPIALPPDDLLQEAIMDLLIGKRNWPWEKVKLHVCIFNIVKSKVSHIEDKWKRLNENDSLVQQIKEPVSDILGQAMDENSSHRMNLNDSSCNTMIHRLHHSEKPDLHELIISFFSEDNLLKKILEYQLNCEDCTVKPAVIAKRLNVDIQDVYNANKRLKRKLKDIKKKIGAYSER